MLTETLLEYQTAIAGPNGDLYRARACGGEVPGGTWQGWIEFLPIASHDADGGGAVRTSRETTQPNRRDLEYWATGLTPVYLEGALVRALGPARPAGAGAHPPGTPTFDGPAPRRSAPEGRGDAGPAEPASVLDPFAAYAKGEAMLRRQLGALSAWHLTNIVMEYELADGNRLSLERTPPGQLIELIVSGVRGARAR